MPSPMLRVLVKLKRSRSFPASRILTPASSHHAPLLTAGESHGKTLIALVDGFPAGVTVDLEPINVELRRRQGGYGRGGRQRIETDAVNVLSGVWKGVTLGSPIALEVPNRDNKLDRLDDLPRPRPGSRDRRGRRPARFRTVSICRGSPRTPWSPLPSVYCWNAPGGGGIPPPPGPNRTSPCRRRGPSCATWRRWSASAARPAPPPSRASCRGRRWPSCSAATKVAKTSPSAGFAGPGWPEVGAPAVSASLRTASFPFSSPGSANGSFENQALWRSRSFFAPFTGGVAAVPGGDGGVEEGGGVVELARVHRLVVVPDQVEEELLRVVDVLRVLGGRRSSRSRARS